MSTRTKDERISVVRQPFGGIYTVGEVALYLRATTPPPDVPLRLWRRRQDKFIGPSSRHLYAWIRRGLEWHELAHLQRRDLVVSFSDLVRLRMIVILRSRGFSMKVIRKTEQEARRLTGSPQPFVTEQLWTSSSNVFVELAPMLISASSGGQIAMEFLREFLNPINHGLLFGADQVAQAWQPSEDILVDPAIQFGAPCIAGTRITTESIWSFHQAGDSTESLGRMYGLNKRQVDAALDWEGTLARAT